MANEPPALRRFGYGDEGANDLASAAAESGRGDPDDRGVKPLADSASATLARGDAVLARWLGFVQAHPLAVHLLVTATLTAVVDLFVAATRAHLPPVVESVALELAIVFVSLLLPAVVTAPD